MSTSFRIRRLPGVWRLLAGLWALGVSICGARADVEYRAIFPGQGLAGVDFDGDGAFELTFSSYALTTHAIEASGMLFMAALSAEQSEVLVDGDGRVLPLSRYILLSPTPAAGIWSRSAHAITVWTYPFVSTSPSGTNIIEVGESPIGVFPSTSRPPLSTNLIALREDSSAEDLRGPTPWGVGMPGCGSFLGVRFQRAGAWHYGWVHFGVLEPTPTLLPTIDLPSVLGFAYESTPDVPVEVGSKPQVVAISSLELVKPDYLRVRWSARIGQDYHVETRRHLDWHAWSPMSLRIPGVAEEMTIDLPIIGETMFFRVIEAD